MGNDEKQVKIDELRSTFSAQNSLPSSKKRKQSNQESKSLRFVDNESLSLVSSSALYGMVLTKYPSSVDRDIVLNRFQKEIVERFHWNHRPFVESSTTRRKAITKGTISSGRSKEDNAEATQQRNVLSEIVHSRLCIGTNQCTRVLERAVGNSCVPRPLLIMLARDVRPPHMLAHIPVLAKHLSVPLILLSGKTSVDLGAVLGIKLCAIALFLPRAEDTSNRAGGDITQDAKTILRYHQDIDSFIEYAKSKIPQSKLAEDSVV